MAKRWRLFRLLSFLATASSVMAAFHPQATSARMRIKKNEMLQDPRYFAPCENNDGSQTCPRTRARHLSAHNNDDAIFGVGPSLDRLFETSSKNLGDVFTELSEASKKAIDVETVTSSTKPLEQEMHLAFARDKFDLGSSTEVSFYGLQNNEFVEGAALKLEDTMDKFSQFSNEMAKSSSTNINDMMGDFMANLKSSADVVQTRDDFADAVTRQLSSETLESSKESVMEFSNNYVSSLDSTYKVSEFLDTAISGSMLTDSINAVAKSVQDIAHAMDFKQNAAFILLLASTFWGSDQKRVGLERGKKISEAKIMMLESELKAAEDSTSEMINSAVQATEEENKINALEVGDMRKQMEDLQSQVAALTAAAQEVTKQLEEAKARAESAGVAAISNTGTPMNVNSEEAQPKAKRKKRTSESLAAKEEDKIVVPEPPKSIEVTIDDSEKLDKTEIMEAGNDVLPMATTKTTSKVKGAKATKSKSTPTKKKKKVIKKKAKTTTKKQAAVADKAGKTKVVKKKIKTVKSTKTKTDEPKAEEPKIDEAKAEGPKMEEKDTLQPDWGRLSASTLKRKTVKELTGYLALKGVESTDENGKILKKDSLVGLVLSK